MFSCIDKRNGGLPHGKYLTESEGKCLAALVVDDEQIMVTLASLMLEDFGFKVDAASNGVDAIGLLKAKNYDLVLTDLMMPLMDGYELANWIRKNIKNTTLIAMTGSSCFQVKSMMDTRLADGLLLKPFRISELSEILHNYFPGMGETES